MRALFGLNSPSTTRKVVGSRESIDIKQARYIQESKGRLASLHKLYKRYKSTPHGPQIKAVYEKTRLIHHYLVSRNRGYELELFHLQHTEHFINAFSVILDVHEKQEIPVYEDWEAEVREALPNAQPRPENVKKATETRKEMPRPLQKQQAEVETLAPEAPEPLLSVPLVAINTIAKVYFGEEEGAEGLPAYEIGYLSTPEEKESFLQYVGARLNIKDISYLGNASINFTGSKGSSTAEMVPVIYWRGQLYALNLNDDCRLFPVQIYRRSS